MHETTMKDSLRQRVIAARNALSPKEWEDNDAKRTAITLELLAGRRPGVLAAYTSRAGEPGTHAIIDGAIHAGWQVLLPVLGRNVAWGRFCGWENMETTRLGIAQPTGETLAPQALGAATLIIVPALAVAEDGTRLGMGGGWYDKALPLRKPGIPVWALTRSTEVMAELPTESHDVAINGVITDVGYRALA